MTTPQIYGLFAMLTVAAIAGLIFYCIGLRTGRQASTNIIAALEQSKTNLGNTNAKLVAGLIEVNRTLDAREGALSKLRQSLIEEQRDHGEVERGLLNRLAAAYRLTTEDQAVLVAIAAKLSLAADTFAGLNAHDHAKASRLFQAQALDMADRIEKALANQQPHPDTEIIEWLNTNGDYWGEPDHGTLRFDVNSPEEGFEHLRDVLTLAIQQKQADTESATTTIGNWREQEAERAA
ncbi:hypothetical protein [Pseudomonas sp.]|uniref:hypothetical protein n=1 Tax=Pseudomonas sp. TaxID=306 RepID=UPI0027315046|nr:hypothetical protein [Pseudomonas sp.]MDP2447644.1 hypothetical protein [Pseudomonas sp.]MDZ4334304.1 hypothetical protein [Pseudomonas sp.]